MLAGEWGCKVPALVPSKRRLSRSPRRRCTLDITERIAIFSDDQSLLKAIKSGAYDTQHIRRRLGNWKDPAILIWVQVHKGKPVNEAANELAKAAAATTDTPPRPISFYTAKALIRRSLTDPCPAGPKRSLKAFISP